MSRVSAKLLKEDVGSDGSYSALFEAYGVEFLVHYVDSIYRTSPGPKFPKKPSWQLEAATRLCQSAAYERVKALGEDFQRLHRELYRKEKK
jgi:hypothetical protein